MLYKVRKDYNSEEYCAYQHCCGKDAQISKCRRVERNKRAEGAYGGDVAGNEGRDNLAERLSYPAPTPMRMSVETRLNQKFDQPSWLTATNALAGTCWCKAAI